jgi:hypothetical protein
MRYDAFGFRGDREGVTVIRRAYLRDHVIVLEEVSQADCPQIAGVARAFSDLPPPRTRLADVRGEADPIYLEGPADEIISGGPVYRVLTAARFENLSMSRLEYTAGNVSPVAEWFEQSAAALEPCWRVADPDA